MKTVDLKAAVPGLGEVRSVGAYGVSEPAVATECNSGGACSVTQVGKNGGASSAGWLMLGRGLAFAGVAARRRRG